MCVYVFKSVLVAAMCVVLLLPLFSQIVLSDICTLIVNVVISSSLHVQQIQLCTCISLAYHLL